jgi:hypothetical protein
MTIPTHAFKMLHDAKSVRPLPIEHVAEAGLMHCATLCAEDGQNMQELELIPEIQLLHVIRLLQEHAETLLPVVHVDDTGLMH